MSVADFDESLLIRSSGPVAKTRVDNATPAPQPIINKIVNHPGSHKLNFGTSFQTKALAIFLRVPSALPNYHEVIKPQHFDSTEHATLCDLLFRYFKKFKAPPTAEVFRHHVSTFCSNSSVSDKYKLTLLNLVTEMVDVDLVESDYILDKIVDFARLRFAEETAANLLNTIETFRMQGTGSFEQITPMIRRLSTLGVVGDYGYSIPDNIDDLPAQLAAEGVYSSSKKIPTSYPTLDRVLGGGLAPGEFGFVVAPPGVGKSTQLIQFAAAAIMSGSNVMIYSMELQRYDYALRLAQRLCGVTKEHIEGRSLRYKDRLDYYKTIIAGRQVLVKEFPPRAATVDMLRSHFSNVLAQQEINDPSQWLVIVDYADLLKLQGTKNAQTWEMIGNVVYELIAFAREYRVPLWTASQVNREGTKKVKGVGGKTKRLSVVDIAGAIEKANAADVLLFYTQNDFEKAGGIARAHIAKCRRGKDGISFRVKDLRPIMSMIELDKDDNPVYEYRPKRGGDSIIMHRKWDNSTEFDDEKNSEYLRPPDVDIQDYLRELTIGMLQEEQGVDIQEIANKLGLDEHGQLIDGSAQKGT